MVRITEIEFLPNIDRKLKKQMKNSGNYLPQSDITDLTDKDYHHRRMTEMPRKYMKKDLQSFKDSDKKDSSDDDDQDMDIDNEEDAYYNLMDDMGKNNTKYATYNLMESDKRGYIEDLNEVETDSYNSAQFDISSNDTATSSEGEEVDIDLELEFMNFFDKVISILVLRRT
ncbi:hypothetical protein Nepgr_004286 [Nepenthes gracilis]|uniref:Uncharacterized protein n=1 Tax=Nepenthes gracilis TaxID=150966 RepID=A0AAD3S124_NEPGR|nr:hypothetical protein Nepgr_004286 [Nepenthes gracilis]